MRRLVCHVIIGLVVGLGWGVCLAGEKAPRKVVDLCNSTLVQLGADELIVKAVQAQNAENKTLEQIKEMDRQWQATAGITGYMKALMDSDCGRHLRSIQQRAPYFAEIFVMDNQGAIVAMSEKTSDYWQGDEDKFNECYMSGKGAVHISEVKFDESTQAYLVQVSVPVKDGDKVVGAMTMGIDIDKM